MFADSQHFLTWLNEQKVEFESTHGLFGKTETEQLLDRFVEVLVNRYVVEDFNDREAASLKGAP